MKHSEVLALVNNHYSATYENYVEEIYNGNLPKALSDTVLSMVVSGLHIHSPEEFKLLADALQELHTKGFWGK